MNLLHIILILASFIVTVTSQAWTLSNLLMSGTKAAYGYVDTVAHAAQRGLDECKEQFKWDVWNCPPTMFTQIFNKNNLPSNKETAFVHAIISAAIVHTITRNCSKGQFDKCRCDPKNSKMDMDEADRGGFKWAGCSDDLTLGTEIAKSYLDSREVGHDSKAKINLHNNNVGRMAVQHTMKKLCKCHGVSGSCQLQTCWMRVAEFNVVGSYLKDAYRKAIKVSSNGNNIGRIKRANLATQLTVSSVSSSPNVNSHTSVEFDLPLDHKRYPELHSPASSSSPSGYRDIDKDGKGSVAMTPEEPEDMWHAYNIIQEGDHIRASTIRKVVNESATGSTTSTKIRMTLTIQIEQIEYDTHASVLRVKGRNVVESNHVKEKWDSIALGRLEMACDISQKADVAAVMMQEGLAHIILVTPFTSLTKAKVDTIVPRKRKGNCSQHEKGLQKFYENVIQAILRHINFDVVKSILIASPGFVKDHFFDFMMAFAGRNELKVLIENKSKFLLVHSSSGFKHSLKEVLADPIVQSKLVDTKAAAEVKALEKFHQLLATEPDRAYYGLRHVEKANEFQAIETLLVSDTLFRSKNLQERQNYVNLVDSVRANDGDVKIFSSLHTTGEQLDQLTGVAAILRFPVPQVEEEVDSSTSSEEE